MIIGESMYGSDRAGLVWAYWFIPGHAAHSIDSDQAAARLVDGNEPPGFVWLHFNLTNAATVPWLRRHLALPDPFYELARERSSTRIETVADALLAVVNDVQFFSTEPSSTSTVSLYVADRMFVSARTTPLRAVDRLRASVRAGERFRSPAELMAHLLRDQADVLVDIVRDVTRQIDLIEDAVIAQQPANRSRLGTLRRVLVRLQRLLAPEPAALFRLLSRPPKWLHDQDMADLRQSAEELAAAVSDSAALVERIRLLQEELIALLNEQTNRTLFILTVVTVLALPLTIIPGLFGMNVGGIPFSGNDSGFMVVLVLVAIIVGLGTTLAWTWRNRA